MISPIAIEVLLKYRIAYLNEQKRMEKGNTDNYVFDRMTYFKTRYQKLFSELHLTVFGEVEKIITALPISIATKNRYLAMFHKTNNPKFDSVQLQFKVSKS